MGSSGRSEAVTSCFKYCLITVHKFMKAYNNFFICFQRLQGKVIKLVDVSYGGENGFNQAIELAAESLANVKFIQEKKLIGKYVFFSV